MKYTGRILASLVTTIAMVVVYIIQQKNGFQEPAFIIYVIRPLYIVIAWFLGKQYDKAQDLGKKLKVAEEKYKSLFHEHPDAVYEFDNKGVLLKVNDSLPRMLGYSRKELIKSHFIPFVQAEDLEKTRDHFERVLQGTPQRYDIRGVKKDGSILNIDVTNLPIYIDGNIVGVYGIAKDVTEQKKAEEKLTKTEKSLREVLRDQQGLIFKFEKKNGEFIHTLADGELLSKAGFVPDEIIGQTLHDLYPEREANEKLTYYQRAWEGNETTYEGSINGISYFASLRPLRKEGIINEVIASCVDITERKEAEEKYRIIAENSSDLIRVISKDYFVTYASPSHERVLNYKPEEVVGKNIKDLIHPDDFVNVMDDIQKIVKTNQSIAKELRYKATGKWIWVEAKITPILNSRFGDSFLVVAREISERKEFENSLKELAYHDILTGLSNRRKFEKDLTDEIAFAIKHNTSLALMYLDLDRFKIINDTLGHDVGDDLLVEVAGRLQTHTRQDDLVVRMGGDEFVILLPKIRSKKEVKEVAERITQSFLKPIIISNQELYITTSIGISLYPKDARDKDSLLRFADIAMYEAKEHGKNKYLFYKHKDSKKPYNRLQLENHLRKSISLNELSVEYQPRVNVLTDQITGAEALLRWDHPQWGRISPVEFIPVAEEIGLINSIGEWIIEEVCKQQMVWAKDQLTSSLKISVNLSLRQFMPHEIVGKIKEIVKKYKCNISLLEFEITESMLAKNMDLMLKQLEALKKIGANISIDDFGTGYSSLGHLKMFPIDTLKVDRSFITKLDNDHDSTIAKSIISLGKFLNLKVVAEGIETQKQLEFIKKEKCDEYQGFIKSPAVTPSRFIELLEEETSVINRLT